MKSSRKNSRRDSQIGFSLIESLAALAVMAVSLGAGLPSFKQAAERRHLEGAAAQLATDIRMARGLAVSHQASVRFSVQQASDGACYVIHTGRAGDCRCTGAGTAVCVAGAQALRSVGFAATGPVQFSANSASMLFDADRGTVTPTGTLSLQLRNGAAIRHIVNIMGRVRSCSPAGVVSGHAAC